MTKMTYVLADGTEVKTYAEALKSGQRYTAKYERIPEKPAEISEKRKAMRVKAIVK